MGYSSVQLFGRESTVKAFRNTDCVNWSLMQGKQLLFKYEGSDQNEGGNQLDALLKMIADSSGSDAVYTLRWYERDDIPEPKQGKPLKAVKPVPKFKIYTDTPFDGSVNFKLFDLEGENGGGRRSSYSGDLTEMKKELADTKLLLQQLIKNRNEQDSEDEKVSGITGFINGLMDVPEIKQAIAGKVIQLFNGVTNKVGSYLSGPNQVPAKIAGPEPAAEPIHMPQDQIDKLNAALVILAKADPALPDHLFKLAMIAKNDQAKYDSLLVFLNGM